MDLLKGNAMSVQEMAKRNSKKLNITNPVGRHLIDADCRYENGKFILSCLPDNLPSLFTVRFTAPADYTQGNTIVVRDKELPVRTPGMVNASTGLFVAGAVMHCDVDMDREIAFFWQSGGGNGGVMPNLSYDEQFAGFTDEDGNPVYMKTVNLGQLPSSGNKRVPHGITNLNELIDAKFRWNWASDDRHGSGMFAASGKNYTSYHIMGPEFVVYTGVDRADYLAKVILYYTCNGR